MEGLKKRLGSLRTPRLERSYSNKDEPIQDPPRRDVERYQIIPIENLGTKSRGAKGEEVDPSKPSLLGRARGTSLNSTNYVRLCLVQGRWDRTNKED